MLKILISGILIVMPTWALAGNCSNYSDVKGTKAEAQKIKELQIKASEAKKNGDLALFEALLAQARNVIEKKQMN